MGEGEGSYVWSSSDQDLGAHNKSLKRAGIIVNANHIIVGASAMRRVSDFVVDCVRLAVPQATEWQRIGNQIDAAMIFAWAYFVSVHIIFCETPPQAS